MVLKSKKVSAPPSQSQFTGGPGNNEAEPAWKNWLADLHATLDSNGLLEEGGGSVKGYPYMKPAGEWVDRPYGFNEVVVDYPWTAVCVNKDGCFSRPKPQLIGDPEQDHDGTGFSQNQYLGLVKTAHQYTFTKQGKVTQIEVFVPEVTANTMYDLYVVNTTDEDPITVKYNDLQPTPGAWSTIVLGNTIVGVGTQYTLALYSQNSTPSTEFAGGWTRGGNSNNAEPATAAWNRSNNGDIVRVNHTDLDSTGRETELLSAIPGTELFIENTANNTQSITYSIVNATAGTASVNYDVVTTATGPSGEPPVGATCRLTFRIPTPANTQYYEEIDGWNTQPTFATVEGAKELGGIAGLAAPNDIYGIRITFQELAGTPTDWEFLAHSSQ